MKTIKFSPEAPGIKEIEGQLTVLSAETANVEFGEFHSFKTGVGIQIPEGKVGLLLETQPMGSRGVTLSGKLVTPMDLSELRVGMLNNSRNAFPVQTGMPIARLLILDASSSETLEESTLDDWQKLVEEAKEKRNAEAEELHGSSVLNGPGKPGAVPQPKRPAEDGSAKSIKANEEKPSAETVNADAKAKAEGKSPLPSEVEKKNKETEEAEEKESQQKEKEKATIKPSGAQGGSAGASSNTPVTGTTGGTSSVSGSTTSGGATPTGGTSSVGSK